METLVEMLKVLVVVGEIGLDDVLCFDLTLLLGVLEVIFKNRKGVHKYRYYKLI